MIKKLALFVVLILVVLTVFQISLIAGAPLGKFAWGGQYEILPTGFRIGSVVSILIYAFISLVVLQKARLVHIIQNQKVIDVSMRVITIYFFLGIALNLASQSPPERAVMTPVVIALALLCLAIIKKSPKTNTSK